MDNSIKWVGGGLLSSAEDLIRYSIALDEGRLGSANAMNLMSAPGALRDGTPLEYSLGWELWNEGGTHYVDKYGSGTGVSSYLLRIPAQHLALAVLVNVSAGNIKKYARELAAAARR